VRDSLSSTLRAVSDAVLSVAAEHSVEEVLQRLVESARELVGARYAALGTPDGDGGFSRFLTAGMSDELVARLGPLPRTHGMLGAMLETSESFRTPDIHADPVGCVNSPAVAAHRHAVPQARDGPLPGAAGLGKRREVC
jgi:GAF domain